MSTKQADKPFDERSGIGYRHYYGSSLKGESTMGIVASLAQKNERDDFGYRFSSGSFKFKASRLWSSHEEWPASDLVLGIDKGVARKLSSRRDPPSLAPGETPA